MKLEGIRLQSIFVDNTFVSQIKSTGKSTEPLQYSNVRERKRGNKGSGKTILSPQKSSKSTKNATILIFFPTFYIYSIHLFVYFLFLFLILSYALDLD